MEYRLSHGTRYQTEPYHLFGSHTFRNGHAVPRYTDDDMAYPSFPDTYPAPYFRPYNEPFNGKDGLGYPNRWQFSPNHQIQILSDGWRFNIPHADTFSGDQTYTEWVRTNYACYPDTSQVCEMEVFIKVPNLRRLIDHEDYCDFQNVDASFPSDYLPESPMICDPDAPPGSGDCPPGYLCVGGFCLPTNECVTDSDCPEGYRCENGLCVEYYPPPDPCDWVFPTHVAFHRLDVGFLNVIAGPHLRVSVLTHFYYTMQGNQIRGAVRRFVQAAGATVHTIVVPSDYHEFRVVFRTSSTGIRVWVYHASETILDHQRDGDGWTQFYTANHTNFYQVPFSKRNGLNLYYDYSVTERAKTLQGYMEVQHESEYLVQTGDTAVFVYPNPIQVELKEGSTWHSVPYYAGDQVGEYRTSGLTRLDGLRIRATRPIEYGMIRHTWSEEPSTFDNDFRFNEPGVPFCQGDPYSFTWEITSQSEQNETFASVWFETSSGQVVPDSVMITNFGRTLIASGFISFLGPYRIRALLSNNQVIDAMPVRYFIRSCPGNVYGNPGGEWYDLSKQKPMERFGTYEPEYPDRIERDSGGRRR